MLWCQGYSNAKCWLINVFSLFYKIYLMLYVDQLHKITHLLNAQMAPGLPGLSQKNETVMAEAASKMNKYINKYLLKNVFACFSRGKTEANIFIHSKCPEIPQDPLNKIKKM